MKNCDYCGEEIKSNLRRCPFCGSLLKLEKHQEEKTLVINTESINANAEKADEDNVSADEDNVSAEGMSVTETVTDMMDMDEAEAIENRKLEEFDLANKNIENKNIEDKNFIVIEEPYKKEDYYKHEDSYKHENFTRCEIKEKEYESKPLSNGYKVFLTVISTVIPGFGQLLGIISAIIFMNSDDDSDRRSFGVALLIATSIMFIFSFICFFVIILAAGSLKQ
jgi:hypothetical protein